MNSRKYAAALQSPGTANSAKEAYQAQLNKATPERKELKSRIANSDDVVVNELMRRRGDEEAHHKSILNTLAPLYDGLSPDEAAELTAYLSQHRSIGNHIGNLINLPKELHQAGIHAYARDQGYEHHPNLTSPQGFVRDIQDASELPLEYRKHVGEQYLTKAVPAMNDYINDALTASPAMQEKLDMSAVRRAIEQEARQEEAYRITGKRMAGDVLEKYFDQSRVSSPGESTIVVIN